MSHPMADAIGDTVGALRADKDMKDLLDQLGKLTDKHIEDLDQSTSAQRHRRHVSAFRYPGGVRRSPCRTA